MMLDSSDDTTPILNHIRHVVDCANVFSVHSSMKNIRTTFPPEKIDDTLEIRTDVCGRPLKGDLNAISHPDEAAKMALHSPIQLFRHVSKDCFWHILQYCHN